MRALLITRPGGPEVLQLGELAAPQAGPGEILVRVRAAGVNRADVLQRMGRYPAPAGVPADVPGLEFAGQVAGCGPGVTRWREGDRVMGLVGGGAFADLVVLHQDEALPVPDGLSWTDAAAIPEVFATAFDALVLQARLVAGEAVLIHAAASGVGTAAVQIARRLGARVLGSSRTPAKLGALRPLGLTLPITVAEGQFADPVQAACPNGVNVILDCIGAAYLEQNLRVLAPQGRMVVIGLLGGASAEISLGRLLARRLTLIGSVLRSRSRAEKMTLAEAMRRELLPGFVDGALSPVVQRVYPREQVAQAHAELESNRTVGKLVVAWP